VGQATEREFWRSMVEAIRANPYCNGQNDRGWVADFDYLVRGKTWVRFVEKTGWFDAARRDASLAVQNAPRTANETRAAIRAAAIDQTAGRDFFTPDEEQEPKAS
jgi:hypothetical protein